MTATVDRTTWPWCHAPRDCQCWDTAVWFAVRHDTDGELPRQSLGEWVAEQGDRRHRAVLNPTPTSTLNHDDVSVGEFGDDLLVGAHELSPEARGRLLAEFAPLFERVEQMRPAVWREWLLERLSIVAGADPWDAAEEAARAVDALGRIERLSKGTYDDALVRIYLAGRAAETWGVSV